MKKLPICRLCRNAKKRNGLRKLKYGYDRNAIVTSAKYVWMVVGGGNPCDIRRYQFTHSGAVAQLKHRKQNYRDVAYLNGVWTLFKLVRVNKRSANRKGKK